MIDYTALSLAAPEKVHFRLKLEGQDPDWREVVNRRRVEYSNLPPGPYRFRVIASNNSGVWNESGDTLEFSIEPAYYQTNWFRALGVATLLAMIWAAYRLSVRTLKQRQHVLQERQDLLEREHQLLVKHEQEISDLNEQLTRAQEQERIRIAGELHDGVLQQITSLNLRLGTATLKLPPDSEAKSRIKEVQQKLMQVGVELRHLSHELHPVLLQESGLPMALTAYCEEFSRVRAIPVSCEVDETIADLSLDTALALYRIAQEALGNVAKHSKAKRAEVRLGRSNGNVCLSVFDDGVGFTPDGNSGGLGLINMRERVHQLHGTFEFHSQPGRGIDHKSHNSCSTGVLTYLDSLRFCGNGPRQQAAGTRRVANLQIHFCQPERLVWIGTRSKPEFGCMVSEGLRVPREQLVIALRSQPTPVPGFAVTARVPENPRKLRGVIRIIRGRRQRAQGGNGGINFTQFRFDLGEMALRLRVSGHTAPRGVE